MKQLAFFLIVFFSAVPARVTAAGQPPITAMTHTVTVSAKVPLSKLWAEAIAENSDAYIISTHPVGSDSMFAVTINGLDNKPMEHEDITARISSGNRLVTMFHGKTERNGEVRFSFTPQKQQKYDCVFTDTTYEHSVTIQEKLTFTPPVFVSTIYLI